MLKSIEKYYWANKGPIDRAVVISWLLKDSAWMATIVWQGMIFGAISIVLHAFYLIADARITLRFHHMSMLCWVIGNYLWMIVEFYCTSPSSHVHIGLDTPVGGITEHYQYVLVHVKHWLFMSAVICQVIVYTGFYFGFVPVPTDEEEDALRRGSQPTAATLQQGSKDTDHEVTIDLGNRVTQTDTTPGSDGQVKVQQSTDSEDDDQLPPASERIFGAPMVVCEYLYLWPWVLKDLFWSWATGDFGDLHMFTEITSETLAIIFGCSAMLAFAYVAVLYRHNLEPFLDSVTSVCWVAANLCWMCGEFFIRYDNMEFDDHTEQNDTETRIFSSIFFLLGLSIQFCIVTYHVGMWFTNPDPKVKYSKQYIELVNVSAGDIAGDALGDVEGGATRDKKVGHDYRDVHAVVTNAMHS
jgi:hypothetical protein